jgi:4-hydroxy-tetrahydrodipicolinate synthase
MSHLLNETADGVYVIAATPFTDTGALDEQGIDRLTDVYHDKGVTGMTILGMMGESHKLSSDESRSVVARYLKRVDGRIPVVVGVSSPGVDPLLQFTRQVMDLGAAGVMVAPVNTVRTEEQIYGYFSSILEKLSVPTVVQDYPLTTNVNISVATLRRLFDDYPQIVMLKHEDCPGHAKLTRLTRSEGRRVSILVGNGGLYLPQELRRGADGAMTGFAYPEMLVDVCAAFKAGDPEAGEDLFDIYLPLLRHEAQPGLGMALRKELLRRRGAIASAHVRAPGPRLTKDDHLELDSLVGRLERRLNAGRTGLRAIA